MPDIKQRSLEDAVQPAVHLPQEQWVMRKADANGVRSTLRQASAR